jgi:hypothetical protein
MLRYTRDHARAARQAGYRARHALRHEERARAQREHRDALKRELIEELGGKCARCDRTVEEIGHVSAFDFHHVDWRNKRYNICGNYSRSRESLRAEIAQCIVLCACCHRIVEVTTSGDGRRRGRPPLPAGGKDSGLEATAPDLADFTSRIYAQERIAESSRQDRARDQPDLFDTGRAL